MHLISTPHAPAAIGPYSQAVVHQGLVFCSGQIALDPTTGAVVGALEQVASREEAVILQTRQLLSNLNAVLKAAGSGREYVLKTTVFLQDMADFPVLNRCYAEFFGDHRPARATVAAAGLPRAVLVEIECVAVLAGSEK
jgi:2-iminobutanoate/2-iminopropanoate deaminase